MSWLADVLAVLRNDLVADNLGGDAAYVAAARSDEALIRIPGIARVPIRTGAGVGLEAGVRVRSLAFVGDLTRIRRLARVRVRRLARVAGRAGIGPIADVWIALRARVAAIAAHVAALTIGKSKRHRGTSTGRAERRQQCAIAEAQETTSGLIRHGSMVRIGCGSTSV